MISLFVAVAFGQQTCIAPLSRIQLGAAVGDIGDALEVSDLLDAQKQIDDVFERLPCLDEPVDPHLVALFARYRAIMYFYAQDEDEAVSWGAASSMAEPRLPWDERLYPRQHPVRILLATVEAPAPTEVPDRSFVVPRGGGVFLNGAFAPRPAAAEEVPYLVQIFDKRRERVDAYWQRGARFHEELLADGLRDTPTPAWLGSPVTTPSSAKGGGGGAPLVPILAASSLLVASGAAYAWGGSQAARLPNARDEETLTALRTRANLAVVGSAVALTGAVGVGVGGVLLSGRF